VRVVLSIHSQQVQQLQGQLVLKLNSTLKYSHDAPLVVNSLIYNDKKETTLFNGGNLYYKLGDNSYRITANGVSEIYDCTTRTYPYVLEQLDIQVQRLGFTIHCYVVVMALVRFRRQI
jgi:hypothetical protein